MTEFLEVDEFSKDINKLNKKYKTLFDDLETFKKALEAVLSSFSRRDKDGRNFYSAPDTIKRWVLKSIIFSRLIQENQHRHHNFLEYLPSKR
jgi:hypothetical protein